jgi:hypothetical protein
VKWGIRHAKRSWEDGYKDSPPAVPLPLIWLGKDVIGITEELGREYLNGKEEVYILLAGLYALNLLTIAIPA